MFKVHNKETKMTSLTVLCPNTKKKEYKKKITVLPVLRWVL